MKRGRYSRPRRRWAALLASGLLAGGAAVGHTLGFHKNAAYVFEPSGGSVLVTLDVPKGERSRLLRLGVDRNRDGILDGDERELLKAALMKLVLSRTRLSLDGRPVELRPREGRIDLHASTEVSEVALSGAVLAEFQWNRAEGKAVSIDDAAPDGDPVMTTVGFDGWKGEGGLAQTSEGHPLRLVLPGEPK